jgi:tetratricopeptide (TPR) repeat protein
MRAAAETIPTGETDVAEGDTYEVNIEKPMGIRFARGNDGAAYVLKSDPRAGNTDDRVEPGDKLLAVSASFGPDVWEAKNFGQVMYAVRTRNGGLYFKLLKRDGDLSIFEEQELSDAQKRFQMEKAGGNYGTGTKEMQERNYVRRKEQEKEREQLFEGALKKFNAKDIEGALIDFENVLAMEPKNYVGDNFSRITDIYRVTQYNIACCYAAQGSVDAGLEALSDALRSGFDQYKVVREDKNLDKLRSDPRFTKLIDEYDEPVFNTGALKALRSIFGGNK